MLNLDPLIENLGAKSYTNSNQWHSDLCIFRPTSHNSLLLVFSSSENQTSRWASNHVSMVYTHQKRCGKYGFSAPKNVPRAKPEGHSVGQKNHIYQTSSDEYNILIWICHQNQKQVSVTLLILLNFSLCVTAMVFRHALMLSVIFLFQVSLVKYSYSSKMMGMMLGT